MSNLRCFKASCIWCFSYSFQLKQGSYGNKDTARFELLLVLGANALLGKQKTPEVLNYKVE